MGCQGYAFRTDTESNHRSMIRRVIRHMADNLSLPLTLGDLAECGCASPYHFNRVFRGLVGIPPMYFLSLLRIDGAKRLLLDTAESVTAICYEVGFQSLSSFSRRFKELVGLSPRDFRTLGTLDLTLAFDALPSRRPTAPRGLADQVVAPPAASADEATGLIVVGLFSKPVPDASPAACALLDRPGPYRLSAVSDGDYHLFASAMPPVDDPRALLVIEDKLRAGSTTEPVRIAGDQVDGSTRLELRAPRPEDPPILMVAPPLVRLLESFQAEETYAAASY